MPRRPSCLAVLAYLLAISHGGRPRQRQDRQRALVGPEAPPEESDGETAEDITSALLDTSDGETAEEIPSALLDIQLQPPQPPSAEDRAFCQQFDPRLNCDVRMIPVGKGSNAHAFLAEEKDTQKKVVVKVLYWQGIPNSPVEFARGPESRYLFRTDLLNPMFQMNIQEAIRECDFAEVFDEAEDDVGQDRVVKCYSHNLAPQNPNQDGGAPAASAQPQPLYMVLQFCGMDLSRYWDRQMRNHTGVGLDFIAVIVKQVLEGVRLFQSFEPIIYIHHDLKPQNIAFMKEFDHARNERVVKARIIDLGAMLAHNTEERGEGEVKHMACGWSTHSVSYAPYEISNSLPDVPIRCNVGWKYHPYHPEKFDMFAVASTLLQLLSGKLLPLLAAWMNTRYAEPYRTASFTVPQIVTNRQMNFEYLWNVVSRRDFVEKMIETHLADPETPAFIKAVMTQLRDNEEAKSFVDLAIGCLSNKPADRPSPSDLLEHAFMVNTVS